MYCKYKCNTEARSCNHGCRGKEVLQILSVYVALVIQHAKRTRRVVLSVACPAVPYFSKLSKKIYEFRKKLLNIKCVLVFSTNFVWHSSHSKKNWPRYFHKCRKAVLWSDVFTEVLISSPVVWNVRLAVWWYAPTFRRNVLPPSSG
jgi:hypothetical protein